MSTKYSQWDGILCGCGFLLIVIEVFFFQFVKLCLKIEFKEMSSQISFWVLAVFVYETALYTARFCRRPSKLKSPWVMGMLSSIMLHS